MISFELTGPLTLETFNDRAGDGSHGGRIKPGEIAESATETEHRRHNESGRWEEGEGLAEQPMRANELDKKRLQDMSQKG